MSKASVNVTELRSRLSTYLNKARNGEEVLIRDRNLVIAKLVPLSSVEDFGEGLLELAAQGLVRLPEKRLDLKAFFAMPAPEVPLARLRAAIDRKSTRLNSSHLG